MAMVPVAARALEGMAAVATATLERVAAKPAGVAKVELAPALVPTASQ